MAVYSVFVGIAASLCYPGPLAGTEDRLDSGHEATGRNHHGCFIPLTAVDVWLAIGNYEEIAAIQLCADMISQSFRCPKRLIRISEPGFHFCGGTRLAHAFCKRRNFSGQRSQEIEISSRRRCSVPV